MKTKIYLSSIFLLLVSFAHGQNNVALTSSDIAQLRTIKNHIKDLLPIKDNTSARSTLTVRKQLDSVLNYKEVAGSYKLTSKTIYEYNGTIETMEKSYSYVSASNTWKNVRKIVFSRLNNGAVDEIKKSTWDEQSSTWKLGMKKKYNYNSSGKIDTIRQYAWNNNRWDDTNKTIFSYLSNGKIEKTVLQVYNTSNGRWTNNLKSIPTYDANGKITEIKFSGYRNGNWQEKVKNTYTYSGNLLASSKSYFNIGTWSEITRATYQYDAAQPHSNLILPEMDFKENIKFDYQLLVANEEVLDFQTNNWISTKNKYKYSNQNATNINDFSNENLSVYPNPSSTHVMFGVKDLNKQKINVQIFDITGKNVLERNIINNEPIDIEFLNKGIYIYNVTTPNQKSMKGKLIVN